MKSTNTSERKLSTITTEFKRVLASSNPYIAFKYMGEKYVGEESHKNSVKFQTTLFSSDLAKIQAPDGAKIVQCVNPTYETCGFVEFLYKSQTFILCDHYSLYNKEVLEYVG